MPLAPKVPVAAHHVGVGGTGWRARSEAATMISSRPMRDCMKPRFLGWLGPHAAYEALLVDDDADADGYSTPGTRIYRIRAARRGPAGRPQARAGINLTGEELDAIMAWWRKERRVRRMVQGPHK